MIRSSDGRRLPVGPGDGERKGEPAVGGRQICLGAGIILGGLWVWSELRGQTPLPPWPAETVPAARPRLTQPVAATAEAIYVRLSEEQTAQFRQELGFWRVVPDAEPGANPTG